MTSTRPLFISHFKNYNNMQQHIEMHKFLILVIFIELTTSQDFIIRGHEFVYTSCILLSSFFSSFRAFQKTINILIMYTKVIDGACVAQR